MEITIFDNEFAHEEDNSFIGLRKCERLIQDSIKWCRDTANVTNTCVFTDTHITMGTARSIKCVTKIALVLEPRVIRADVVEYLLNDDSEYDVILTHDSELLEKSKKAYPCPAVLHFVQDWSECEKTKLVSMVASGKNWAPGHILRQKSIHTLRDRVDLFGREINPIEIKDTGLRKYMFSIAIENCKDEYYFTEKLLDCFTTRTVPLYWGASSVNDAVIKTFFRGKGVITFDTLEELESIVDNLSEETYHKMKDVIEYNHMIATTLYQSLEHYLVVKYRQYFDGRKYSGETK
jgi:hypothetical protein